MEKEGIKRPNLDEFPEETHEFLLLIKLLKNVRPSHENFTTVCARLLEFYPVNTTYEEMLQKSDNIQPYIVAKYQESRLNVHQYFLMMSKTFFPLKVRTKFVTVVDLLFKLHQVCYLKYATCLEKFYYYMDQYVYAIEKHPKLTRNLHIYLKISTEVGLNRAGPSNEASSINLDKSVHRIISEETRA